MPSEHLKAIEEHHGYGEPGFPPCNVCREDMPCNFVKMARALDRIRIVSTTVPSYQLGTLVKVISEETLAKVSGSEGSDEHPTGEPVR